MSFEIPFSKPAGWPVRKIILIGIVALHSVWIIFHLNLVSRELINPWKLGGYGMYTTVHPAPRLHVFDKAFMGVEVPLSTVTRRKFTNQNNFFSLQCRPLTEDSIQEFFKGNPNLIGHTLRFFITQRKLLRSPIRAKRQAHAILEIVWIGPDTFQYTGQVCGKVYEGQLKLQQ